MSVSVFCMIPRRNANVKVGLKSPKPKNWFFKSHVSRQCWLFFFDNQGAVHIKLVLQGTTVTNTFYKDVLDRLLKRGIFRVRSKNSKITILSTCMSMHPHTKPLLTNSSWLINASHHLSYSPDLSPPDYFVFPKFKLDFKGDRFESIEDIQKVVTDKLKTIPVEAFQKTKEDLKTQSLRSLKWERTTLNNISVKYIFFTLHSWNSWDRLCLYILLFLIVLQLKYIIYYLYEHGIFCIFYQLCSEYFFKYTIWFFYPI